MNIHWHPDPAYDRPKRPSLRPVRRIRLPPRLQGGAQLRALPQRLREEHPDAHGLQRPARRPGIPRGDALPAPRHNLQRRLRHDHREGRGHARADAEERARERRGAGRDVLGLQVPLHRPGEDRDQEGRRPPGPRPRGLREGALGDPPLRQGAHGASRHRRFQARGDVRRPARGAVQGHQGQDGVPGRRGVRPQDPGGIQVPALQVRAIGVQGRLHQDHRGP